MIQPETALPKNPNDSTTKPVGLINNNPRDMYPHMKVMRWDIINALIQANGYKSYLEIGVFNRELNFNKIACDQKICVDPAMEAGADFIVTSDVFFNFLLEKPHGKLLIHENAPPCPSKFDLIFIDGLHTGEQVHKDVLNALKCLNKGGTIVCHDLNPTSEEMASSERKTRLWCGSCWEAWVKLRSKRNDLVMYVIDTDFGVGIIRKSSQPQEKLKPGAAITYKNFDRRRTAWLNLVKIEGFKMRCQSDYIYRTQIK